MCGKVGGIDSVVPFAVAAPLGNPLVDADGMGRAFPEWQAVIPPSTTNGPKPSPGH